MTQLQTEENQKHETLIQTHSWYEAHLDAFYLDLLKLKTAQNQQANAIIPEYVEYSCQQIFIQTTTPYAKPLTRYDQQIWGRNQGQVFTLFFALLDAGVYAHQQGCLVRQFSMESVLVAKNGFKVLAYYQETEQNTLTVHCPLQYCSQQFYNFNQYIDYIDIQDDLINYRKYLAFPATLRLRQKIKFTIGCDIYSLGAMIFRVITTQDPPSPFDITEMEQLEQHKLIVQKTLMKFNFNDQFIRILLKMLFFFEKQFYFSLLEIQNDVQTIFKQLKQQTQQQPQKIQVANIISYEKYLQLNQNKSQFNVTTTRIVIDHLIGAISYQQLQKLNLKIHLYQNKDLYQNNSYKPQYMNFNNLFKQQLSQFAEANLQNDLNKTFASDHQGRLAILQGYFGSGKTQIIYDILSFFSGQFFSFTVYVPTRDQYNYLQHINYNEKQLPFLPSNYLINNSNGQYIKILDFNHYLTIYIMYQIQKAEIPRLNQRVQKAFQNQNDINKLFSICPSFHEFINIGQNNKQFQISNDITKEVLFKLIECISQCSLLVILAIDDLQSNIYQNESNQLFALLEHFGRLCIITTEVPSLSVNNQSFCLTGTAAGAYTDEIVRQFENFQDYTGNDTNANQQNNQAQDKRVTTQVYSDIMSVGSCRLDQTTGATIQQESQSKQQEIRTKCYIYVNSVKKKISATFQAVNYLSQAALEELLKVYELQHQDFVLSLFRKSMGSIKLIKKLLFQLYQHSGWIQPNIASFPTLEQLQVDEIMIIGAFLRSRQLNQISAKEIEMLHIASTLGYFVDQMWLFSIVDMRREQIQSLCTQIGSQNGYIFSFALQNTQTKHKNYIANQQQQYIIENIFVWQSTLACKLFAENFTTTFNNNLFRTAKFLLQKYKQQFSFIEKQIDRMQLYIPSQQSDDKAEQLLENLVDDLNNDYQLNLQVSNIKQNSSLVKLIKRTTPSRLIEQFQNFKTKQLTAEEYFQEFDGLFISIELLLKTLNPCCTYLPDLFDQIELMQLNQNLLQNVKFLGQIPKIYFQYLDYAIMQQNETLQQLQVLKIEQKINITDQQININVTNILQLESKHVIYYLQVEQLYQVLNSIQNDFIEFQVQQLRHTQFSNINKFKNVDKLNQVEYLKLIQNISIQLILENRFEEAVQLSVRVFDLLNSQVKNIIIALPGKGNVNKQTLYNYLTTTIINLNNYLTQKQQKIDFYFGNYDNKLNITNNSQPAQEYQIHSNIFTLIQICIIMNKLQTALNLCLGLINKSIDSCIFTEYTIQAIYFVYYNFDQFISNQQQKQVEQVIQTINQDFEVFNELIQSEKFQNQISSHSITFIQIFYNFYHQKLSKQTTSKLCTLNKSMFNYIQNATSIQFSLNFFIIIPIYLNYLFQNKNYQQVALLTQYILKDISYVNLSQMNQYILITALCAMRLNLINTNQFNKSIIQQSETIPTNIAKCDTLFDYCQIVNQLQTELAQQEYIKCYKLAYVNDQLITDQIVGNTYQQMMIKLKLLNNVEWTELDTINQQISGMLQEQHSVNDQIVQLGELFKMYKRGCGI